MAFVIRKFDYSENLGAKLKAIRRSANFTLSEMETKTKIRKSFLKAFETGDYATLPDPIYAKNYLKVYVRALGGDVSYFMDQYEAECGTCDYMKNARLPRRRAGSWQFLVASRYVKVLAVLAVALTITGYVGYQVREIVSPPDLLVYQPFDGVLTGEALIAVTGHAEDGASVKVNGVNVLLSQTGSFEIDVALERGLNIIEIESTKRYSRPAMEYRRVVLQHDRTLSFR